jgi:hypothetical protein
MEAEDQEKIKQHKIIKVDTGTSELLGKNDDLALLTRKEKDWLVGKIEVSKDYENHLRHRIRKKLDIFWNKEFPLLTESAFITIAPDNYSTTTRSHQMTADCHDSGYTLGRWSSLVKIPPQTWRMPQQNDIANQKQDENLTKQSEMGLVSVKQI